MIKICNDCLYNNDGFCEKTYKDNLDTVKYCFEKIKDFGLSFYYNEEAKEYRVVAYSGRNGGEVLKQSAIPNDKILKMLDKENKKVDDSIISNIINIDK